MRCVLIAEALGVTPNDLYGHRRKETKASKLRGRCSCWRRSVVWLSKQEDNVTEKSILMM